MNHTQELQTAKDEAQNLFIDGTLTVKEISTHLNIEHPLLIKWINTEDWETIRDNADAILLSRANANFKKHIAKKRLSTAQRHSRIAEMLETQIEDRIKESKAQPGTSKMAGIPISSRELKDMAQALKLSADTSARATLLSEKQSDYTEDLNNASKTKRLISVNIMPVSQGKTTINVTEEGSTKELPTPITEDFDDPF